MQYISTTNQPFDRICFARCPGIRNAISQSAQRYRRLAISFEEDVGVLFWTINTKRNLSWTSRDYQNDITIMKSGANNEYKFVFTKTIKHVLISSAQRKCTQLKLFRNSLWWETFKWPYFTIVPLKIILLPPQLMDPTMKFVI